jgi:hypothetical protein
MMVWNKSVAIHPSGTPKDLNACERGEKSSKGMRAIPKPYGRTKCVGVIRDGKYVDPDTNEPIEISKGKPTRGLCTRINRIGGIE